MMELVVESEITTEASLCGICLKAYDPIGEKCCDKCKLQVCELCRKDYVVATAMNNTIHKSIYRVCKFCDVGLKYDHMYRFCKYCDDVIRRKLYIFANRCCHACYYKKTSYRSRLPHYKAKLIIERFLNVKDVAQIIFDYYYKPRRYFPGEI